MFACAMKQRTPLTIIIPTLNEAEAIGVVLDSIPLDELRRMGYSPELLVVDGGSTDGTREIALSKGAKVIVEKRRGYGRAYKTGFKAAQGSILVTLDGDATYPAHKIPELLKNLSEDVFFINCNRFTKEGVKAFNHVNLIGNWLLTLAVNLLFSLNLKDSQSGMWILRREVVERIDLEKLPDGMAFSESIKIKAFKMFKCREVDVGYSRRMGTPKLRRISDFIGNLAYLFKLKIDHSKKLW